MNADALTVEAVDVHFGAVQVLNGLSFSLRAEETLALVGESGSGKSVTAMAIMGLLRGGRISSGRILLAQSHGTPLDVAPLQDRERQRYRGGRIGMIFQEPMSALNPSMTIGVQLGETLALHRRDLSSPADITGAAHDLLARTGIKDPASCLAAYPHQISGGMRQRVMIAMALGPRPSVLIADEPTTALDVATRVRILGLIRSMAQDYGTATLFITHDLGSASVIADRIAVLYAGHLLEEGPARTVLTRPRHPYTRGLLSSLPDAGRLFPTPGGRGRLRVMPGAVPAPGSRPGTCIFEARCEQARPTCQAQPQPPIQPVTAMVDHRVACLRADEWESAP